MIPEFITLSYRRPLLIVREDGSITRTKGFLDQAATRTQATTTTKNPILIFLARDHYEAVMTRHRRLPRMILDRMDEEEAFYFGRDKVDRMIVDMLGELAASSTKWRGMSSSSSVTSSSSTSSASSVSFGSDEVTEFDSASCVSSLSDASRCSCLLYTSPSPRD